MADCAWLWLHLLKLIHCVKKPGLFRAADGIELVIAGSAFIHPI
jgi:hypothetical protein